MLIPKNKKLSLTRRWLPSWWRSCRNSWTVASGMCPRSSLSWGRASPRLWYSPMVAVGLLAGRLGGWLSRRRRARQAADASSGMIMLALGGRPALKR